MATKPPTRFGFQMILAAKIQRNWVCLEMVKLTTKNGRHMVTSGDPNRASPRFVRLEHVKP